jgi:hypothetical protein
MLTLREKVSFLLITAVFPLKLIFMLNYLQIICWLLMPTYLFDWWILGGYIVGKILYFELAFWVENNKMKFKEIYGE